MPAERKGKPQPFTVETLHSEFRGIELPGSFRKRFEVEGKMAYDISYRLSTINALTRMGGYLESDEYIDTHYVLFGGKNKYEYDGYSFRLRKISHWDAARGAADLATTKRELTVKGPRQKNDNLKIKEEIELDFLDAWPIGTPRAGQAILRRHALEILSKVFGARENEKDHENKIRTTYHIPDYDVRVAFETVLDQHGNPLLDYIEFESLDSTSADSGVAVAKLTKFINERGKDLALAMGIGHLTVADLSSLSTGKFVKKIQEQRDKEQKEKEKREKEESRRRQKRK